MSDFLQLVGSMITAATIFLMMITFYLGVGDTAGTQALTTMVHESGFTAIDLIDRDMRKIGLRVADSTNFLRADSAGVVYRGDDDDNGTPDTIAYGLASAFPDVSGLEARVIYRRRGTGQPVPELTGVTQFSLRYFGRTGAPAANLKEIAMLSVSLTAVTPGPSADTTPGISWERTIRPRNLR
jgi:hypothetical protein